MYYRVYGFDSEHKIFSRLQLTCRYDKHAIAFTSDVATRFGMKLWQKYRLVAQRDESHRGWHVIAA